MSHTTRRRVKYTPRTRVGTAIVAGAATIALVGGSGVMVNGVAYADNTTPIETTEEIPETEPDTETKTPGNTEVRPTDDTENREEPGSATSSETPTQQTQDSEDKTTVKVETKGDHTVSPGDTVKARVTVNGPGNGLTAHAALLNDDEVSEALTLPDGDMMLFDPETDENATSEDVRPGAPVETEVTVPQDAEPDSNLTLAVVVTDDEGEAVAASTVSPENPQTKKFTVARDATPQQATEEAPEPQNDNSGSEEGAEPTQEEQGDDQGEDDSPATDTEETEESSTEAPSSPETETQNQSPETEGNDEGEEEVPTNTESQVVTSTPPPTEIENSGAGTPHTTDGSVDESLYAEGLSRVAIYSYDENSVPLPGVQIRVRSGKNFDRLITTTGSVTYVLVPAGDVHVQKYSTLPGYIDDREYAWAAFEGDPGRTTSVTFVSVSEEYNPGENTPADPVEPEVRQKIKAIPSGPIG